MKYLDHACGLRLKTAAKVIAIAGMVLSVIGFSVAVDRLTKMKIATKSKISNDTKVIEEEFLIDKREAINGHSESGSGEVTTFPPGVQDITASVENHQTEEDDGAGEAEVLLPLAGGQHDDGTSNGDAESRSRRSIEDNKGSGDTEDIVPSTSPNLALENDTETETIIYDYETLIPVATGSASNTPTPRTESSSTPISSFTTEKEHLSTTTTSEEFDEYEDVPDVEDHSNDSTEDGVHHDDIHSGDSEVSEGTEDNQTEKLQQEDTETSGDGDDSETVSANEDDHEDGFGPSIASQVVTGLGVPITLLGLVSNAILLHSAKKAEKKLIIVWFVWAVVLYMYQVFAMIVNITDLSVYVFLNLALFILSVGAGYVVLSYRKQMSSPSSYDLKPVHMNPLVEKGYMEMGERGSSGNSAAGDNDA